MRISSILSAAYNLFEANIFNIKDEYDGVSLAKYLKQYAQNLPGIELQNMFVKKLLNVLVNDERFHYALRELPAGAPDWAQKAVAAQQLFAFKPTTELNDTVQHIMHYIAAAAEDAAKSPSPDQKVVAQRALAAFPKAENLDTIKKHSDEYFVRGSRKAGREIAGLKELFDAGGGYVWYKIDAEDAFRREGKALQNCIGTIYTKASLEKANHVIAILKNSQSESVVAMRIDVRAHLVDEMKGKNNKPPIEKYMGLTIKFINHMKLIPSTGAMHDLTRASYFWDQEGKQILSKAEAIKKFVKTEPIKTVPGGLMLSQATVTDKHLFNSLYSDMASHNYRYSYDYGSGAKLKIYDLRNAQGVPVATAMVDDTKLVSIAGHRKPVEEVQEADKTPTFSHTALLVQELMKLGLVQSMEQSVSRQMLWKDRLAWDPDKKVFKPLLGDKDLDTDKEHMKWKVYTDPNVITQLFNSLTKGGDSPGDYDTAELGGYKAKDIERLYIDVKTDTEDDDEGGKTEVTHMILKTKDGAALPLRAVFSGGRGEVLTQNVGFGGTSNWDRQERVPRIVNSLKALANKEHLRLPKGVRLNHGLIRVGDKYEQYEPKLEQVPGKIPANKIDLSKMSPGDRLTAMVYVASHSQYTQPGRRGTQDVLSVIEAIIQSDHFDTGRISDITRWKEGELDNIYKTVFHGGAPDTLYLLDVSYGVDKKTKVMLLVDNGKIVRVDSTTSGERWQKWSDYDTVAGQLNQFAADNNLTFDERSLVPLYKKKVSRYDHPSELRVANGKISTAASEKAKGIEELRQKGRYRTEGTDELKFENGTKMVRMDPADQAEWVRQHMSGEGGRGEAWKVFNKDGTPSAIIIVDGKNILSMYGRGGGKPGADVKVREVAVGALPYLKKAAETFGWNTGKARSLQIRSGGKLHKVLTGYKLRAGARRRGFIRREDDLLRKLGLLTGSTTGGRGARSARVTFTMSPQAYELLKKLDDKKDANVLDFISPAALPKDFVPPTRVEKQRRTKTPGGKKYTISTAAPKVGSKANTALAKFRAMTTAAGRIPTRGEFIAELLKPPFNMSKMGAQTYYYTTKAKYGALGESLSDIAKKELKNDPIFQSFSAFLDLLVD